MRIVITRRHVQVALGTIWLLDGLLQLQHFMFTHSFVTQVIDPVAQGQPGLLGSSITSVAHFMSPHIAEWNTVFAFLQLAIGAGLLWQRSVRPAIVASLVWSCLVWWFAEGLGGLLTGGASPLTGAPGAVLLYALIGILVWPDPISAFRTDLAGKAIWATLWVTGSALVLLPQNRAPGAIATAIDSAASGEPGWLQAVDHGIANAARGHGLAIAISLCAAQLVIGLGVVTGWRRNSFLVFGAVLATCFWVFGQSFGAILTGQGTDPNAGPLFVLLAATLAKPFSVPSKLTTLLGTRSPSTLDPTGSAATT